MRWSITDTVDVNRRTAVVEFDAVGGAIFA